MEGTGKKKPRRPVEGTRYTGDAFAEPARRLGVRLPAGRGGRKRP